MIFFMNKIEKRLANERAAKARERFVKDMQAQLKKERIDQKKGR